MRKKLPIPLLIVGILLLGLAIFNFILPKLSLPGSTPNEVEEQTSIDRSFIKEVVLTEDGFSPVSLTIKKGETVSFINRSGTLATVHANPPINQINRFLNLGEFQNGTTVQAVFERAGTYSYRNHLIPEQQGTIVVE